MKPLLKITDLEVNYGNIKALKGISLEINQGDIVCLIGANGAGKSTLLKAVMGLEPLTAGKVEFEGHILRQPGNTGNIRTDRIVEKGIALVPEGRRVFPEMTVKENLEIGAYKLKNQLELNRRMEEQFSRFPILKDRAGQKAGSLSGGEQQMLAIARALMCAPRLLLLDEPGLGLAPLIVADIFHIISRINQKEKVSVFLVEQNAKKALEISLHGYVMETGNIVMNAKSSQLLTDDKVRTAYLGETV